MYHVNIRCCLHTVWCRLIRTVHDIVPPEIAAPLLPRRPKPCRHRNALSRRLLQRPLSYHVDLVGQCYDDALVTTKLEVVCLDFLCISLDAVRITAIHEYLLHAPSDDERPGGRNDGGLFGIDTGIKACRCEGYRSARFVLELCNVCRC